MELGEHSTIEMAHGPQSTDMYECPKCNKQCESNKELTAHMKTHNVSQHAKQGDLYVCQKCGKTAKTRQALERHAAYHEDDRPYPCEKCQQRFKNSDDRGKHYRRLKRDGKFEHACVTCHKHFKSDALLHKHQVMLGCLARKLETVDDNKNNHVNVTSDSSLINAETPSTTTEAPAETPTYSSGFNKPVVCRCKICEMDFKSPELLKAHYRLYHNDLKRQVCIQCGQTLSSKDSLNRHYNIFHQEDFSYACDLCDQKFKIKESLYRHVKFVHTDGGYPCPICKHVFSQPVNLKKHMLMHSKGTPHNSKGGVTHSEGVTRWEHVCEICDKHFKLKLSLEEHLLLHVNGTIENLEEDKPEQKPELVVDSLDNFSACSNVQRKICPDKVSDRSIPAAYGEGVNKFSIDGLNHDMCVSGELGDKTDKHKDEHFGDQNMDCDKIPPFYSNNSEHVESVAHNVCSMDRKGTEIPHYCSTNLDIAKSGQTSHIHRTDKHENDGKVSDFCSSKKSGIRNNSQERVEWRTAEQKSQFTLTDSGQGHLEGSRSGCGAIRDQNDGSCVDMDQGGDNCMVETGVDLSHILDDGDDEDIEVVTSDTDKCRGDIVSRNCVSHDIASHDSVSRNCVSRDITSHDNVSRNCKRTREEMETVSFDQLNKCDFVGSTNSNETKEMRGYSFDKSGDRHVSHRRELVAAEMVPSLSTSQQRCDSIGNSLEIPEVIEDEAVVIDISENEMSHDGTYFRNNGIGNETHVEETGKDSSVNLNEQARENMKETMVYNFRLFGKGDTQRSEDMDTELKVDNSIQQARENKTLIHNFGVFGKLDIRRNEDTDMDVDDNSDYEISSQSNSTGNSNRPVDHEDGAELDEIPDTNKNESQRDHTLDDRRIPDRTCNHKRRHLFKPSSLPFIMAPIGVRSTKNDNNLFGKKASPDERSDENPLESPSAHHPLQSHARSRKNPFIIQNYFQKTTSDGACHGPKCVTDDIAEATAMNLCVADISKESPKQVTKPQNVPTGKFSLIKHMLTLQNEEHFDLSLFQNPLYSTPVQVNSFKKLVEMHKISDDKNMEEYDLSGKQNIPLHWLCLSRSKSAGQKNCHVGQKEGHLGQKEGHLGQKEGHLGQKEGHVGQEEGHLGQKEGHLGQKEGHVGQKEGHVGQKEDGEGQKEQGEGQKEYHGGQKDHDEGQKEYPEGQKDHDERQKEPGVNQNECDKGWKSCPGGQNLSRKQLKRIDGEDSQHEEHKDAMGKEYYSTVENVGDDVRFDGNKVASNTQMSNSETFEGKSVSETMETIGNRGHRSERELKMFKMFGGMDRQNEEQHVSDNHSTWCHRVGENSPARHAETEEQHVNDNWCHPVGENSPAQHAETEEQHVSDNHSAWYRSVGENSLARHAETEERHVSDNQSVWCHNVGGIPPARHAQFEQISPEDNIPPTVTRSFHQNRSRSLSSSAQCVDKVQGHSERWHPYMAIKTLISQNKGNRGGILNGSVFTNPLDMTQNRSMVTTDSGHMMTSDSRSMSLTRSISLVEQPESHGMRNTHGNQEFTARNVHSTCGKLLPSSATLPLFTHTDNFSSQRWKTSRNSGPDLEDVHLNSRLATAHHHHQHHHHHHQPQETGHVTPVSSSIPVTKTCFASSSASSNTSSSASSSASIHRQLNSLGERGGVSDRNGGFNFGSKYVFAHGLNLPNVVKTLRRSTHSTNSLAIHSGDDSVNETPPLLDYSTVLSHQSHVTHSHKDMIVETGIKSHSFFKPSHDSAIRNSENIRSDTIDFNPGRNIGMDSIRETREPVGINRMDIHQSASGATADFLLKFPESPATYAVSRHPVLAHTVLSPGTARPNLDKSGALNQHRNSNTATWHYNGESEKFNGGGVAVATREGTLDGLSTQARGITGRRKEGLSIVELLQMHHGSNQLKGYQNIEQFIKHYCD